LPVITDDGLMTGGIESRDRVIIIRCDSTIKS